MPSVTLPTTEDKNIVKKALPTSKILTSAVARLYIVLPHARSWTYSQRWGAVTFCKDEKKHNAFFIRLVDLETRMGVIWEQELYQGFEYTKYKAFFHVFDTDDYLAGFEFVDEGEAEIFYNKVTNRDSPRLKDDANTTTNSWKRPSRQSYIDKNTIGNPADFRHVGHIGYTNNNGFTIENSDTTMIEQLKALGITPEEIRQNQDYIHQFLNQYDDGNHAKNTNSASPRQPHSAIPAASPIIPTPPTSLNKTGRRLPPPPPPRKKTTTTVPPTNTPQPPSTTFPPIPPRGTRQSHTTPTMQPNVENLAIPPPPPPPPPPPMMTHPPLRSSPLPPTNCPPAPPPPPPSVSNTDLAPISDGRSNLMASIRATGGIGSLKKAPTTRHTSSVPVASASAAAAVTTTSLASTQGASDSNGENLASSLAVILKQRQTAMQSDDEDDDDDWE